MSVERQGKPRAFFYFRRAQKIAQKNLNPVSIATVNREIGLHLASIGTDGTEFFEPAHEIYRAELGEADFRTALMAFHLGNIELSKGNHKRARNLLESSVRGFETHDSYREFEMTARGFLIAALEELGQREEATRHCLVIGEKKPLAADEEMTPVYRQPPAFPKIALRNFISGFALVEFTVDEQGFTQNHQVVDASSQVFHNTSIESAKTLRFAPRFVDGEPVATDGVTFRFGYEVVGDRPFSYIKGRN